MSNKLLQGWIRLRCCSLCKHTGHKIKTYPSTMTRPRNFINFLLKTITCKRSIFKATYWCSLSMLLSHQDKIIFIVSLKSLKCYPINGLTVHGNRQCYLNWSCCKMISANSSYHFLELLHRIKTGIFGKHYTSNI